MAHQQHIQRHKDHQYHSSSTSTRYFTSKASQDTMNSLRIERAPSSHSRSSLHHPIIVDPLIPLSTTDKAEESSNSSETDEGRVSNHTATNNSDLIPTRTIHDLEFEGNNLDVEKGTGATSHHFADGIPGSTTAPSPLPELRTYPIAWLLLFCIVCIRAAVAIFSNTFSPIPSVTAEFMGVSLSSINWLYNIMAIAYIFVSFFTSYLYKKTGVKWSLFISGVLLSVGCWIRWIAVKISPPSFIVMMIGQTIASLSSPISLNIMTMFTVLWFTENRRATAGMFIASNYGTIIAMFLIPAIATGKDKIELTVIVVAAISTVCTIPFLFFPRKPKTPASYEALREANNVDNNVPAKPQMSLMQEALLLLKNPQFIILFFVHGFNIGLSIAWNGLMNQAISPYGYSDGDVGMIAALGVVGGSFGCLVSGPVIDRTKQHKVLLKIMTPLMFTTYVAFVFVVKQDSFAAILYTNMLSQFFLSFILPICVELGVECTYPVTPSLSTSLLWQGAQFIGFVLVIIMDLFRDPYGTPKGNMYKALVFQAIIAGLCMAFALIFNGRMARSEALQQQEKSERSESAATLFDEKKV
ncbi:major facilitator superfamily domain-containing protein [Mycotypha africana]|uniref:major facilitator superfamily domain-containing protein n=1 Tax=Mycotypha africana TaxID=64632 RepID=UPI0023004477|nr:major facilitator superfamily domain-containing protein [Mycotypha africana]KAI8991484.1 major facilitator superfamily domain-containing protein [Mycotypha africana]